MDRDNIKSPIIVIIFIFFMASMAYIFISNINKENDRLVAVAEKEGYEAEKLGILPNANPYLGSGSSRTMESRAWLRGYMKAKEQK